MRASASPGPERASMASTLMEPDAGSTRPSIPLSVLVFPAPFGPRRPKISPRLSRTTRLDGGRWTVSDPEIDDFECELGARPLLSHSVYFHMSPAASGSHGPKSGQPRSRSLSFVIADEGIQRRNVHR